jgi:hypothetical protein
MTMTNYHYLNASENGTMITAEHSTEQELYAFIHDSIMNDEFYTDDPEYLCLNKGFCLYINYNMTEDLFFYDDLGELNQALSAMMYNFSQDLYDEMRILFKAQYS